MTDIYAKGGSEQARTSEGGGNRKHGMALYRLRIWLCAKKRVRGPSTQL